MAQNGPMTEAVLQAMSDQLAARGGGMVTGFICTAEFLDADGDPSFMILEPVEQMTQRSLGMVEYVRRALLRDVDLQLDFHAHAGGCDCGDDDSEK